MTHLIVYVHGALSSHKSFAFIDQNLEAKQLAVAKRQFGYDIRREHANAIVPKLVEDVLGWQARLKVDKLTFIGHSYGGVLSVAAAREMIGPIPNISVISLATPYGGSSAASFLKFLKPSSRMFDNIGRYNKFMSEFSAQPLPCRVRGIVTTAGAADWIAEDNDGVVSVGSQLHYSDDPLWAGIKLDFNHFEVLLADRTVQLIEKELAR